MGDPRNRLPRGPHAPKPGPDEKEYRRSGADLQNGWLSRHGDLVATQDRLVFLPTALDTVLGARRRGVPLDEITEIERYPVSAKGTPTGGRRPRMLLHTADCVYQFMVGDLDSWIDSLERIYRLRVKRGASQHVPVITREDYENLLLDED
jgi:hypothetical protein